MSAIPENGPAALQLIRQRDFRMFVSSLSVWSMGRWMESLALGWLVLQITNSPFMLGLVSAARTGPTLLAPLGGTIADRMERARLLGLAQTTQALISLTLGILAITGHIQVWQVLAFMVVAGMGNSFAQPSRQSLVFDLAGREHLVVGNAIMRGAMRLSYVIGSPLAGFIIARWGVAPCLFLVAVLDILGAVSSFMIHPQHKVPLASGVSLRTNITEVLHYVRGQPTILWLLTLEIAFDTFVQPYSTLMPVFARDVLKVGPQGLGFLSGAAGAGALVGALVMALVTSKVKKGAILIGSYIALGGALLSFSLSPWYYLSIVLLLGVGMMDSVAMTLLPALIQRASPENMRGRVMGVYVFTWAAVPVGGLQAGAMASWLGAPFAVGLGGVVVAAYAAVIARWALRIKAWD